MKKEENNQNNTDNQMGYEKLIKNDGEIKNINIELMERADKILSEFGAEGAYKMARFLRMLADIDVGKEMQQ